MVRMERMTNLQFCAHDENETSIQWVPGFHAWVLTDKRGVSIEFERFTDAFTNMCIITDRKPEHITTITIVD